MRFGQLKEYNMTNIFLKKLSRKWGIERVVPDLFSFFRKALSGKSKSSAAYFQYILIALFFACNKN